MLIIYLVLINALGFFLMIADKSRARKNRRRVPEATLMFVAVIGGSVGSLAGMYLVRHKTRHLKFTVGIPVILALQTVAAILITAKKGTPR